MPRGLAAINGVIEQTKNEGRAAFMPYLPIGYPDYDTSLAAIRALAEAGADIIEIGVPFSDPLADGPTIQAATQIALENGITPRDCIKAVKKLREDGIETPMVLMGYLNPFIAYGYDQLIADALAAGIDGFIIPDLPADEAGELQDFIDEAELGISHFVAPTSSEDRIKLAGELTRGYIYLVSVTGITGDKEAVPTELIDLIEKVRAKTSQPVGVGFGIRTPEKARAIGAVCDGIFVGTAIVKAAGESIDAVKSLAAGMRQALGAQKSTNE